jgi:hypothetical protein
MAAQHHTQKKLDLSAQYPYGVRQKVAPWLISVVEAGAVKCSG